LGYPEVRGRVSGVILVLRILRIFLRVSVEVCAKSGGDWFGGSGVKGGKGR